MRPLLVLSSVAFLSMAAASAQAQTSSNPAASPPPAASTHHQADQGYDSRAHKRKAREAERSGWTAPGYAQTSKHYSGNNAGYLVPFGPPS